MARAVEIHGAWLAVGLLVGALPAAALAVGLETRYVLYGVLGLAIACLAPYVVAAAGSLERLLWVGFVLSLQLELAWAPVVWPFPKVAGPYGVLISPTLLVGVAFLLLRCLPRLFGAGEPLRVSRSFKIAALCFLATAMCSLVRTPAIRLSAFGIFEIIALILTAIVASDTCSRRNGVVLLRSALFTLLLVQSTIILLEQATGIQISLAHGINTNYAYGGDDLTRFAGTFGAPSVAASYITVCLLLLFARLFSEDAPSRATPLWWLFGIGFLALLVSRTRSAWIAAAIGFAGLGWGAYRSGLISRRAIGRLLGAAFVAFLIAWPLVSTRLADNHEESAEIRGNLVTIALVMIKANPIFGVGLNTATNQVASYAAAAGVGGWVFIVHNQFLLVAAETGIPGFLAFLGVIGVGAMAARRCMRSGDALIRETGAVLFWSLMAMIWALNLDHVSGGMSYFLIWFLVGAACGLDILCERQVAEPASAMGRV